MGRAFAESVPAARAVFEDADRAVGYGLTELCFEGPIERLVRDGDHAARARRGDARVSRRGARRAASAPIS